MYIWYCDLFFSQIYENESGRKSFRPKTLIYRVSRVSKRHTPSPMSLEGLCISYYFFFSFFYLKVSLDEWTAGKTFLANWNVFVTQSAYKRHVYTYIYTLVKWYMLQIPTTYGMCSTVTDVFRRVGFFSKIARNSLFLCVLSDKNT